MQVILQADVSVDTFFVLSGFLSAYVGLRKMEKMMRSRPSAGECVLLFLKAMLLRYLRLVPLLGFVIWYAAWVFPSLGDGPLWAPLMKTVLSCRTDWWSDVSLLLFPRISWRKEIAYSLLWLSSALLCFTDPP